MASWLELYTKQSLGNSHGMEAASPKKAVNAGHGVDGWHRAEWNLEW